jgi:hypothetical protein
MHSARTPRATRPLVVALSTLAVIAFLGACRYSAQPSPTAPRPGLPVRPDGELPTTNAAPNRDILRTDKGLDVQDDPSPPPRTRYRVEYHYQAPSGGLLFGGSVIDVFSHRPTVSNADIGEIVSMQFLSSQLPLDPSGTYIVMASPEVSAAALP